jgi:hypothetical protein
MLVRSLLLIGTGRYRRPELSFAALRADTAMPDLNTARIIGRDQCHKFDLHRLFDQKVR